MELRLELCVLMLLAQVSLAVWRRETVYKGQTLTLHCPVVNAHVNHVDWKNPDGLVMFFRHHRALKDKRYSIDKLSKTEFSISVSDVTFKDGGNYTCTEYNLPTAESTVEVTVLGIPRMTITKHDGKTVIKCTAEGNHHSPRISWQIDNGPEFFGSGSQSHREDRKHVSVDQLHINPNGRRVAVKCLVRHPALRSPPLMNFVKIGRHATPRRVTTTAAGWHTAAPRGSAPGIVTERSSNTDASVPSTPAAPSADTRPFTTAASHVPSTGSRLGTTEISMLSDLTTEMNDTISNETSTGVINNGPRMQTRGGSTLLVLLVTCLIVCLLVVVIFFAIKLRRAHITWKKENEECDPSEESSKSKSSQEDKSSQAQRRRGLFNAFTQYVAEEPTTTVAKDACVSQVQTATKAEVKETEL